jgi:hypothetical protein
MLPRERDTARILMRMKKNIYTGGVLLERRGKAMTEYLLEVAGYALAVFVAAQIYEKIEDKKCRNQLRK